MCKSTGFLIGLIATPAIATKFIRAFMLSAKEGMRVLEALAAESKIGKSGLPATVRETSVAKASGTESNILSREVSILKEKFRSGFPKAGFADYYAEAKAKRSFKIKDDVTDLVEDADGVWRVPGSKSSSGAPDLTPTVFKPSSRIEEVAKAESAPSVINLDYRPIKPAPIAVVSSAAPKTAVQTLMAETAAIKTAPGFVRAVEFPEKEIQIVLNTEKISTQEPFFNRVMGLKKDLPDSYPSALAQHETLSRMGIPETHIRRIWTVKDPAVGKSVGNIDVNLAVLSKEGRWLVQDSVTGDLITAEAFADKIASSGKAQVYISPATSEPGVVMKLLREAKTSHTWNKFLSRYVDAMNSEFSALVSSGY